MKRKEAFVIINDFRAGTPATFTGRGNSACNSIWHYYDCLIAEVSPHYSSWPADDDTCRSLPGPPSWQTRGRVTTENYPELICITFRNEETIQTQFPSPINPLKCSRQSVIYIKSTLRKLLLLFWNNPTNNEPLPSSWLTRWPSCN